MIKILGIFILLLQGCSVITYEHRFADGQYYKVNGYAFGTTKSIEDFKLTSTPDSKSVAIGKYGEDQTQAIKAAVEGAIQGMAAAATK